MEASRAPDAEYGPASLREQPNLELIRPQDEGVFDLPEFDNQFKSFEDTNEKSVKEGSIRFETATMEDGTPYPVVTGTPQECVSDTAVVFSTAWMTSTKGHNRHTFHRIMRHGYPVIMIGPESQLRNKQQSMPSRLLDAPQMSLPRTVHNMNRILDEKLSLMDDIRKNEIIVLGESRGAMTGFGFDVEQYSGDRTIVYADLTAPCFARKPALSEMPSIALQLVPEIATLGKLGIELFGIKLVRQKFGTLHDDPEYYLKEIIKTWNLMNGHAGQLAKATRPETAMHLRTFKSDGWSQTEEWEKALAHKQNLCIEVSSGFHLDIAQSSTLKKIGARLTNLAQQRGYDGSFENVDFEEVLSAGAKDSKD